MTYTPIPPGTLNWDVPVNAAFSDQDTRISSNAGNVATNTASIAAQQANGAQPSDYGLLSWAYDPAATSSGNPLTSGLISMVKVFLNPGTVSSLGMSVNTPGSGLVANQSFMGLYDQSGNLLGTTADLSVVFTTAGYKQNALVSPATIPSAGFYYVAMLCNGTTPVNVVRASNFVGNPTVVNLNLPASQFRFATGPSGTSLPASINMTTRSATVMAFWVSVA